MTDKVTEDVIETLELGSLEGMTDGYPTVITLNKRSASDPNKVKKLKYRLCESREVEDKL